MMRNAGPDKLLVIFETGITTADHVSRREEWKMGRGLFTMALA
jgi:hypothetical protein